MGIKIGKGAPAASVSADFVGLDPSTKTGMVVIRIEGGKPKVLLKKRITAPHTGIRRANLIADEIIANLAGRHVGGVALEGYAFGNAHSLADLVVIGTIMRVRLMAQRMKPMEVQPTALKKFVTGHGASKKEVMIKEVFKQWGLEFQTNDEADAFGLAMMAATYGGAYKTTTKAQLEAISMMGFCN